MDKHLLIYLLFGTGISIAENEVEHSLSYVKRSCFLDDIEVLDPRYCVGATGDKVRHTGYCRVANEHDLLNIVICENGHWSPKSIDHKIRRKRFLGALGFFIGGACIIFCGGGGGGGGVIPPSVTTKYPPSFPDPCKPDDILDNYNVAASETSTVVSWTVPAATDRDGGTPGVTQVNGGVNGSRFAGATYGKNHYITYKATDDDGLTGHCYFSFTVTILTCETPHWPLNGARSCVNNNILGSTCRYTCNPGYQLTGSDTVTCQNEVAPTWSPTPTCEKITCSLPSYPDHSTLQCTDSIYSFQSVCSIFCDDGFSLNGSFYMQCQADGTWSNAGSSSCRDIAPPTIACVTPQVFSADRGLTSTSVNWQMPTAHDRTDANPSIVQTSGPIVGAVLEVGTDIVTYKAVDIDGNESPECFIELRVKEIPCVHPLDSFEDNYLVFNCSTTRYIYGTSCTLSCTAHLPLEGTNLVTCEDNGRSEGIWTWGTGDKPYCRAIACPDLDPPINGALVYDTIQTRPVYTMMCNDEYDIPDMGSNFNGMLFCTDDGDWTPIDPVPDCIEPRNPRFLNLPGEIFYYGSDCGSEATMAQIEQNFIDIFKSELNPYFNIICPLAETCTTRSITITCGPIPERKKRSLNWEYRDERIRIQQLNDEDSIREHIIQKRSTHTHLLILEFYIVMELKLDNTSLQDAILVYDDVQLNTLKPAIQEMVNNGTLDLQGFVLKSDSFQTARYGDIKCNPGYMFDRTTCKPCPLGYFVNETTSKCDVCPVGQYKDNESDASCTFCPTGYSTKTTKSKSLNDCKELCSPGSYSPNTIESCSTCRQGYYQDEYGQTSCKACPSGTTTESTNRTSANDCKNFDVFIETTNGSVTVSTFSGSLSDITFMFWSKLLDEQSSNAVLTITNEGTSIINVYLTENIRVEIPSQLDEVVGSHSSSSWNHVAITWDTATSNVTIYLGGESVYTTDTISAPSSPLLNNGDFLVTSTGQTGVYLTGLHLRTNALTPTYIANHTTSCHKIESDDVINMDAFANSTDRGISLVVASRCVASDACLSSSCNGHICTNGQNGFTCTCQGGWSGRTCEIHPDLCIDNVCENNATCVSGDFNFTCTCLPGYSGRFCEVPPVDGGWSEWTFSECSKSCGPGTRNKTRQCDSPAPDIHGAGCLGDEMEITHCNDKECPVCNNFETKYGTLLNCSTDQTTGSETCVLYCDNGKFLPPGLQDFQTYMCGPSTNYVWDSLDNPPSCVDSVRPNTVNITVNVDYTSAISSSAISSVEDAIGDQVLLVPCYNSVHCQADLEITQSTLYITFTIPLLLESDIQYGDYISSGTVNDALLELIEALTTLESTAEYIQNHTSELFDVNVRGLTYTVDVNSLTFGGRVTCNSGFVALDGLCVGCPSGTYAADGICNFCEKGTYQSNTEQTSCLPCLDSLTTNTIGSSDISQCIEITVPGTTEKPGDAHLDEEKCSPGSYSSNTIESCSICRHGYYQDEYGQRSCKACPSGTTTESTNSTSVNDCKNFDVFIETTNGGVTVSTFSESLSDMTFMFWSKPLDEQSSNAVLRLTNGGTTLFNVYLTENIRVEIPSQLDEFVGSHSSSSWNHVAITWDTATSNVTIYLGGESVYTTDTISAPSSPLLNNGAFVVASTGQTGFYLTGLHLLGNVLTQADIANHASSCHITETDDVINTGIFDNPSEQGIALIADSSCNASDACLSSPCNGHICTNGQNGFTCTCQGGWSGTTCTIQPDLCIDNSCKNDATCFNGDTNYTCTCLPGYSAVTCPAGTQSADGVCTFCEKGTYQAYKGQPSCLACPHGLTTSTIGASDISQCSDRNKVYIAIAVSVVPLIVAVIVIAFIFYKKNRSPPKECVSAKNTKTATDTSSNGNTYDDQTQLSTPSYIVNGSEEEGVSSVCDDYLTPNQVVVNNEPCSPPPPYAAPAVPTDAGSSDSIYNIIDDSYQ